VEVLSFGLQGRRHAQVLLLVRRRILPCTGTVNAVRVHGRQRHYHQSVRLEMRNIEYVPSARRLAAISHSGVEIHLKPEHQRVIEKAEPGAVAPLGRQNLAPYFVCASL
jgi:hypothetical protein